VIQAIALKLGLGAAILAAVVAGTWGAADAHYSRQYAALKASYEAAAAIQKEQVDRTIADNQAAAEAVNVAAQQQIGSMASVMADLSVRLKSGGGASRLCPAPTSTVSAGIQPDRPAAAASDRRPAGNPGSSQSIAIDAGALGASLEVGIDALRAELLWREYARRTKQAP